MRIACGTRDHVVYALPLDMLRAASAITTHHVLQQTDRKCLLDSCSRMETRQSIKRVYKKGEALRHRLVADNEASVIVEVLCNRP
eukprot:CAMPEP_0119319718 /NCGR_PEP_ID=MMETSP1333-20130426/50149_1 /TAXON_ID=418940 /ORGANISM="Scyphosphaera apsteinii, Strain RCC1455" /LENGTH=84 /DNA_ID=CAMNT_0007326195 /DNA_START=196 /DNA_END=450 /DNA_ORIENTATION=+